MPRLDDYDAIENLCDQEGLDHEETVKFRSHLQARFQSNIVLSEAQLKKELSDFLITIRGQGVPSKYN